MATQRQPGIRLGCARRRRRKRRKRRRKRRRCAKLTSGTEQVKRKLTQAGSSIDLVTKRAALLLQPNTRLAKRQLSRAEDHSIDTPRVIAQRHQSEIMRGRRHLKVVRLSRLEVINILAVNPDCCAAIRDEVDAPIRLGSARRRARAHGQKHLALLSPPPRSLDCGLSWCWSDTSSSSSFTATTLTRHARTSRSLHASRSLARTQCNYQQIQHNTQRSCTGAFHAALLLACAHSVRACVRLPS